MSRSARSLSTLVLAMFVTSAETDAQGRRRALEHPTPRYDAAWSEGGYASLVSVTQGGSVGLHIASGVTPLEIEIVNLAEESRVLQRIQATSTAQDCSGRFVSGCGWMLTTTVDVPQSWPSGYYAARFLTRQGRRHAFFIVREDDPGRTARTLIVSSTHTYQAYNTFGGASLYTPRSASVSYARPYTQHAGQGRFPTWEKPFLEWMREEGRRFEVASDVDLEDPTLLGNYDLVVIVGHSEYWTASAREHLESFVASGGHVAVFGGNTMWWQIRLEDGNRTIVGFKEQARFDPLSGVNDAVVTTHFFSAPVFDPENTILGTSFRNAGYTNFIPGTPGHDMLPLEERVGWTVTAPDHWVYEGTGVSRGTEFGKAAVGLEVDGALYTCDRDGNVITDGSDGTPQNFHILAVAPADEGRGTMGIHTTRSGGTVFNAATQHWAQALSIDPVVAQITRNVLDRLSRGTPLPYDGIDSPVLTQDTFNCPTLGPRVLPGWRSGGGPRGALTTRCAYEGPAGLELSGAEDIILGRALTPAPPALNHVEIRAYVNVDDYRLVDERLTLLVLQRRGIGPLSQPALVQFNFDGRSHAVRLAIRDSAGTFTASEYATLGSGWHLLELSWRSPGTVTLTIDERSSLALQNHDPSQTVNDVAIEYEAVADPDQFVCVDAFAAATEKLGPVPALR